MADKLTRTRAWDSFWTATGAVHDLGGQGSPTKEQEELGEALDELVRMPLPINAIETLASVVLAAWEIGRGTSCKEQPK